MDHIALFVAPRDPKQSSPSRPIAFSLHCNTAADDPQYNRLVIGNTTHLFPCYLPPMDQFASLARFTRLSRPMHFTAAATVRYHHRTTQQAGAEKRRGVQVLPLQISHKYIIQ